MSRLSCAPHMLSLEHPVLVENRINGRRLGTAQPFPLWRLHSGPQSSSVDQYSETPPEHLASTVTEAMRRSVVTRHCLSKKIGRRNGACAPCWVYYSLSPLRCPLVSRCVGGHRGTFSARRLTSGAHAGGPRLDARGGGQEMGAATYSLSHEQRWGAWHSNTP
jgi:hypothetical protein